MKTTSKDFNIKPLVGEGLDYSKEENWLKFDKELKQKVDLFYIYPTVVIKSPDETGISKLDDAHKAGALGAFNGQGAAFSSYTNVFAPFYRQAAIDKAISIMVSENKASAFVDFLQDNLPRTDIYAALDYYFTNVNTDRPFILAGHSQGSSMSSIVLKEYFKVHPELVKRMVACYAIGFPFSKEWIKENPHLKMAKGETDTNCIISWNTEGPGSEGVNFCLAQKHAYNINPLNWKRNGAYVKAEVNKGSLINGEMKVGYADAQIDKKRGALICTNHNVFVPEAWQVMFGTKCLHANDYQLYFENIKENGLKRIEAYLKKNK